MQTVNIIPVNNMYTVIYSFFCMDTVIYSESDTSRTKYVTESYLGRSVYTETRRSLLLRQINCDTRQEYGQAGTGLLTTAPVLRRLNPRTTSNGVRQHRSRRRWQHQPVWCLS